MWYWALFFFFQIEEDLEFNSFPGEERARGLRDDVMGWALWKSDFEMETNVQGVFRGVTTVEE